MVNSLEDVLKEHVPDSNKSWLSIKFEVRTMLYGVDTPALEISEEFIFGCNFFRKLHPKINLKIAGV